MGLPQINNSAQFLGFGKPSGSHEAEASGDFAGLLLIKDSDASSKPMAAESKAPHPFSEAKTEGHHRAKIAPKAKEKVSKKTEGVDEAVSQAPAKKAVKAQESSSVAAVVEVGVTAELPAEVTPLLLSWLNQDGSVNLEALALFAGDVTYVNPISGESLVMTGAELASKIASGELPVFTVENVAVSAEGVSIKGMLPVAEKEIVSLGSSLNEANGQSLLNASDGDAAENPEVAAKGAPKVEIEVKGEKVAVEVSVKEEKIARTIEKPIVASSDVAEVVAKKTESAKPFVAEAQSLPEVKSEVSAVSQAATNLQGKPVVATTTQETPELIIAPKHDVINTASLSQAAVGVETAPIARQDIVDGKSSSQDFTRALGKEVADQVKVNITKSAIKGVDKIDIQLKPQDLGHIEVKLQIGKDGKLQAHVIASRADVADALQRDMQGLEKALNDAGFKTDENSLSFSSRDEASQEGSKENSLRSFMGNVIDEELTVQEAHFDTVWDGKSALNIRV